MTADRPFFPETSDTRRVETWLAAVLSGAEEAIPLAQTALAFAALDRDAADLTRFTDHLDAIGAAARERVAQQGRGAEAVVEAVNRVLYRDLGYSGDTETYDDPRNADLMAVIDRRKGLPIALSILYLHAARAAGALAEGLNFPGHFVIRVADAAAGGGETSGQRLIVDPFRAGAVLTTADLRGLLKSVEGPEAELTPAHYPVAGSRAILMRLLNNIKLRAVEAGKTERGLQLAERMALIQPDSPLLWHEIGVLNARIGHLAAAMDALQRVAKFDPDGAFQGEVAALMQALRKKLN